LGPVKILRILSVRKHTKINTNDKAVKNNENIAFLYAGSSIFLKSLILSCMNGKYTHTMAMVTKRNPILSSAGAIKLQVE
jgi:hypothetical protein